MEAINSQIQDKYYLHSFAFLVFVCLFFKWERQCWLKRCALNPYKWGMLPISTPSKKDRNIFFGKNLIFQKLS